ncbi:uncharacterized protein LOC131229661 [Magnolia sinica]|uniref:uncharacterized protein LOC131229661 n=1 Tax=Magnolia sinica TaxID=86752 RepID=UPI002658C54A|nr:uncharacterized protein LOC131229661 [Magnolia sinica]
MEPIPEGGSTKHQNILKKSNFSSSSSSSEDLFQLNANELSKSTVGNGDAQLASRADLDLSAEFTGMDPSDSSLHQSDRLSTVNMFPPDATQFPPTQVMGKSDIVDPYRIPSSVFERSKSTAPMEWSVASNESLFSIHVGNSSFSRDHVFLMGRSGELTNFSSPTEGIMSTPRLSDPTLKEGLEHHPDDTQAANAETMKEVLRAAADNKAVAPAPGASASRRSDGSGTSIRSFAFPILTEGKSGSVKVDPENRSNKKQEPQTPVAEVAPVAANAKWFPCFSCCPFCC